MVPVELAESAKDHRRGEVDDSFRPNQILAVGGLAHSLMAGERARQVVDAVANHLLTPLGLRSLAPGSPGYAPRYEGGPRQRDRVYHQGRTLRRYRRRTNR
jgi:glycogen debranching enzyme